MRHHDATGRMGPVALPENEILVVGADERFLDGARVTLFSARTYGRWNGRFCLITSAPERRLHWFKARGIKILRPQHHLEDHADYPRSVWNRIEVFRPEFAEFDRVIYLDSDIIVRTDLRPLSLVSGFGAVPDQFNGRVRDLYTGRKAPRGSNASRSAFNSGVFTFDRRTHATVDIEALVARAARMNRSARLPDQALLNETFSHRWTRLPPRYNRLVSEGLPETLQFVRSASVIHAVGPDKPWDGGALSSTWSDLFERSASPFWGPAYQTSYDQPPKQRVAGLIERAMHVHRVPFTRTSLAYQALQRVAMRPEERSSVFVTIAEKEQLPSVKRLFDDVRRVGGWEEDLLLITDARAPPDWTKTAGMHTLLIHDAREARRMRDLSILFDSRLRRWDTLVFAAPDERIAFGLDHLRTLSMMAAKATRSDGRTFSTRFFAFPTRFCVPGIQKRIESPASVSFDDPRARDIRFDRAFEKRWTLSESARFLP